MIKVSKNECSPLISIVVPVYKVENYLDKCIHSITNQTYKNIEIILVDDGSPDRCPSICDNWAKRDSRIKVIHKENGGLSDARNHGIAIATGEYIGFVDSDDFISENMYEYLIDSILKYDADISVCQMKSFAVDREVDLKRKKSRKEFTFTQEEYLLKYFKIGSQTIEYYACNKLFKRSVLTKEQFPVGLTSEDVYGTYKAILKSSKIVKIEDELYYYRQNPNSITGQFSSKDFDLEKIWDLVVQYTKKNAPQYLEYAVLNRKRINFTLLYRMMKHLDYHSFISNKKAKKLLENLKEDKDLLLSSKIEWKRKKLISLFCKNINLAYHVVNLKGDFEKLCNKCSYLLYAFILIVFLEPPMFKENAFTSVSKVDFVYKILKLLSAGVVFLLLLKKQPNILKTKKYRWYILCTFIFEITLMISTLINRGSLFRYIGPAVTVIVMMLLPFLLRDFKDKNKIYKILNKYFMIGYFINLLTIVLVDYLGKTNYITTYFWGIDNRFIFMIIPWLYLEAITSLEKTKKLSFRFWVITINCIGVLLLKYSTSAFFVSLLLLLIPYINKFYKYISTKVMCILYLGLNFVLTSTNFIQSFFKTIISAVGKDITYSGRTYLWNGVNRIIKVKPFFGIGMQSIEFDKEYFFNASSPYFLEGCRVVHAHNSIMTTLYRGGLISLAFYVVILLIVAHCNDKQKNENSLFFSINFIFLTMILLLSLFDTMDFSFLFFIFSVIVIGNTYLRSESDEKN